MTIREEGYAEGYRDGYSKRDEEIVRCKDCKHKPTKQPIGKDYDLDFPDSVCPCQNSDDGWYSYCPADDWFCADGEPKDGDSK